MRHSIIVLLLFVTISVSHSQNKSGEILYVETMKMEMKFEGADAERFKAMMPKERKSKFQLKFTENSSLYETYEGGSEDDEKEMSWSGSGADGDTHVKIKFAQPDNRYFTNISEKRMVNKQEFMGKNFLINGEAEDLKWKISPEQKKILGYTCMKAVLQDTARQVEAWFSTEIPIATGPGEFINLPGIILEVSAGENRSIVAQSIEFKEVGKLIEPTKGKKVTLEKFRAIQKEKMEEMKDMKGGNRIMIIEH